MSFEIVMERVYPHPRDRVWRALTDRAALGAWLMETDLVPEADRDFRMWCDNGAGGTDIYLGRVLNIEPPERMLWSWRLDGEPQEHETLIGFALDPVAGGTRLTLTHRGELDPETIARFKSGWPAKLDALEAVLA